MNMLFILFTAIVHFYLCDSLQNCTCVNFYQCVIKIDEESANENGKKSFRGNCPSYMEICCEKDNINVTNAPNQVKNKEKVDIKTKNTGSKLLCGRRSKQGIDLSNYGTSSNVTRFGELPWMAIIMKNDKFTCTGGLIHPQVVLSAAHCFSDFTKKFKVRLGEWNILNNNELLPYKEIEISSFKIHPRYSRSKQYNDIALAFLKSPVLTSQHINFVCLPLANATMTNKDCFIAGWPKNVINNHKYARTVLKTIGLSLISNNLCEETLRTTRLGSHFQLDDNFICAYREKNTDICSGYGGAPLVCPIDAQQENYQQVGILSWGIGCNQHVPEVLVNVIPFRNWIDAEIKNNNLSLIH